ncbi:MAG TPA: transaldolase [Gemmatimonadaceae bacterium]|nr:transaldolase [Gemmatimonadaceae bacterium]
MPDNPLKQLHDAGQSIWLDFIDRTILRNGELQRRIDNDALTGMTSNPTIFEKALAEGTAYDDQIRSAENGHTALELFEVIATVDVRDACDLFRPVYDQTNGEDGYVSIEVSPGAANDAKATAVEAKRLRATVDRPNVMVKVPGTVEGATAVRELTAQGLNINITLLFAIEAYRRVIDAYMSGLEDRVKAGKDISRIHSVASFFVSRVDSEVDKRLGDNAGNLKGKAAIANAKLAYKLFQEQVASPRWKALAAKGANVQRPLWASTSTKNPAYRDVMYVEELIGPHTVNTMPPNTIDAFRDHGIVKRTVDANLDQAAQTIAAIEKAGVSMKDVTDKLLADGLASFQKSFDTLLGGLTTKTKSLGKELVASS